MQVGVILHMLMASYGWTLDYTLSLTWPQMMMFMRLSHDYPTANIVAMGLVRGLTKDDKSEANLDKLAANEGGVISILPADLKRYASDFLKIGG